MIKQIFTRVNKNIMAKSAFCTSIPKVREDWEYIRQISDHIRNDETSKAFNTIISSYLDKRVLDIQIYYQMYCKLQQSQMPATYKQILYTLYRENFKPHQLMKQWMDSVVFSTNPKFSKLIKDDYQYLGIDILNRKKKSQQKKLQQSDKQLKAEPVKRSFKINEKIQYISSQDNQQTQNQQGKAEKAVNKFFQSDELQQIMNLLGENTKIVLRDIEVLYQKGYELSEDEQKDDDGRHLFMSDQDLGDQTINSMDYYQLQGISKIRIGKIQIIKTEKEASKPQK